MTPELDCLRRLHEAATPGPWDRPAHELEDGWGFWSCLAGVGQEQHEVFNIGEICNRTHGEADGKLIVTLRNLAPELIALLEAVEKMEHYPYGKEHEHPEFQEMWEAFFDLRAKLREVKP